MFFLPPFVFPNTQSFSLSCLFDCSSPIVRPLSFARSPQFVVVIGVPDNWIAEILKMNPDLMSSSSFNVATQQRSVLFSTKVKTPKLSLTLNR